jgi:penicillin-binding protein 1A
MGVTERGTGRRAKVLKTILAGKTGTTNEGKDVWYIGFTPLIVAGTYIGYDNPQSLGKHAYGSNIALPIFIDFMKNSYKDYPSLDFIVPSSVELAYVDYETGVLGSGEGSVLEAFRSENIKSINPKVEHNDEYDISYDPFEHIQEEDHSEELY